MKGEYHHSTDRNILDRTGLFFTPTKMEVIRDIRKIPRMKRTALSIGVFDGVHIGHRKIITSSKEKSICSKKDDSECYVCVLTFQNHPDWLRTKTISPRLISPPYYKLEVFEKEFNIDKTFFIKFSPAIQRMEPEEFIELLVSKIDQLDIFVGYNFRFGYQAKGDTDFLIRNATKFGYRPFIADEITYNGFKVSSTNIRRLIHSGDIDLANQLLQRRFFLESKVIKGKGLGKEIGFPTANIRSRVQIYPPSGVYGTVTEVDGNKYKSVTHVGESFAFGGDPGDVETHIIDFEGDIYNKRIRVHFCKFLGETKFVSSLNELRKVIKEYVDMWRNEEVEI
ncbi:MAG: bifunctional riboflavin kinase/FAD synthetase [Spirochaetia bacterium]|nr:bifunctional riboflavin kinase/FAD synthetase [Spirochaetota bacterium]MCX8097198.1 bifunctional riboflavin kinase/FAD synthetase [Spirochaetota bacterium]MDW8112629.1 bifunctional riboflavin kinase/FAD synthetase [Spirochaetia bacterium]